MKTSLVTKLESLCDRHEEVAALLADAETASDPNKFRTLSQEYAQLDDVVKVYDGYRRAKDDLAEAQLMICVTSLKRTFDCEAMRPTKPTKSSKRAWSRLKLHGCSEPRLMS